MRGAKKNSKRSVPNRFQKLLPLTMLPDVFCAHASISTCSKLAVSGGSLQMRLCPRISVQFRRVLMDCNDRIE
jgi:hypothetical protein